MNYKSSSEVQNWKTPIENLKKKINYFAHTKIAFIGFP